VKASTATITLPLIEHVRLNLYNMTKSRLATTLLLLFCISTALCEAVGKSQLITNLKSGQRQVVVAYGTSLTAKGPWVKQFASELEKLYPKLAVVINSGGSGKWSQWGVKNLYQRVLQKQPDTVIIEFSINDSVERFQVSVEVAQTNLEAMINQILKSNPRCEIILMTMTPGNKYPRGHKSYRKNIEAHYEMYRAVAKQHELLLIEHYSNWKALQSKDEKLFLKFVPDTIHPTATGCSEIVSPVIFEALGVKILSKKKNS